MARRRMARPRYDEYGGRRRGGGAKPVVAVIAVVIVGLVIYWYLNPGAAPGWARAYLPDTAQTIYRWQDDDGQWKYTAAPPSGRAYEKMNYWENANILPSQPPKE